MLRFLLRATAIVAVVSLTATAGLSATGTSTPSIKVGLDLANIDHTCKACDDFSQFATGNWSKLHPIPAAYPSYGNFEILQDQNDDALHAILESAATNTAAPAGSNEQKIGTFYRSCMNEPAIEAADLGPLKAELAKIDAIASTADVNAEIVRIDHIGTAAGWGLEPAPDRKDSSRTILSVSPGQLALPDRDYYLKDDDQSKKLRAVYATYIAATEGFRGIPDAQAQSDAQAIIALETNLRKPALRARIYATPQKPITP